MKINKSEIVKILKKFKNIDLAEEKDLLKISKIYTKRFKVKFPEKTYKEATKESKLIKYQEKSKILGFSRFDIYNKTEFPKHNIPKFLKEIPELKSKNKILFIGDTAVSQSNKGIGSKLRRAILEIAKKEQSNILTIPWNDQVEKWNIKNGYKVIHPKTKKIPSSVAYKII